MIKTQNLIMISAMFENGGNTLHRHLDGHPELLVYPFESQIGIESTRSIYSGFLHARYEYPRFQMGSGEESYYEQIWDEELKTRLRVPSRSKFSNAPLNMSEDRRRAIFRQYLGEHGVSNRSILLAYFASTFLAWEDCAPSGTEKYFVGYNPLVGLHSHTFFEDFPDGHVVHIVRNPFSGFADTKRRPFPWTVEKYAQVWNLMQFTAKAMGKVYPGRFHILRFEDLIESPLQTLHPLCDLLGLKPDSSLSYPSYNGSKLEEVHPWGTIQKASAFENEQRQKELSQEEVKTISALSHLMLKEYGYWS